MILYFSGTGNSRYIAQRLAAATGDALMSINDRIRQGGTQSVDGGRRLVFVTPTYCWRIPRLVERWIRDTDFPGAMQAWFVMSCGDDIGNAGGGLSRLCAAKGWAYMGVAPVVMPENYLAMFPVPGPEEAEKIIRKAAPEIVRAAGHIRAGHAFPERRPGLLDRVKSGVINAPFYALCVRADAFRADERCTGCGRCAQLCPLGNIRLADGRPVWGADCTHCMACIAHCPVQAIEYGRRSAGKPRYRLDG